jgi:hypothetical protein
VSVSAGGVVLARRVGVVTVRAVSADGPVGAVRVRVVDQDTDLMWPLTVEPLTVGFSVSVLSRNQQKVRLRCANSPDQTTDLQVQMKLSGKRWTDIGKPIRGKCPKTVSVPVSQPMLTGPVRLRVVGLRPWVVDGQQKGWLDLGASGSVSLVAGRPDVTAQPTQGRPVLVRWTPVRTADGYLVYRKPSQGKSYGLVEKVKGGSRSWWADRTVKLGVSYSYKVTPYRNVKTGGVVKPVALRGKVVSAGKQQVLASVPVSVRVAAVSQAEYLRQSRLAGGEQVASLLGEYGYATTDLNSKVLTVNHGSPGLPYVKYVWQSGCQFNETLYRNKRLVTGVVRQDCLTIHLYIRWQNGAEMVDTSQLRQALNQEIAAHGSSAKVFDYYKTLTIKGLRQGYDNQLIRGSRTDFNQKVRGKAPAGQGKVVEFRTRLVLHYPGEAGANRLQQYLTVRLGGAWCGQTSDPGNMSNLLGATCIQNRVFGVASVAEADAAVKPSVVSLPWRFQLDQLHQEFWSEGKFMVTAAHELGHAMGGLADNSCDQAAIPGHDRFDENTETAIRVGSKWLSLMKAGLTAPTIIANDLEMMLTAFTQGFTPQESGKRWEDRSPQYYKDHTYSGLFRQRSKVIITTGDKEICS